MRTDNKHAHHPMGNGWKRGGGYRDYGMSKEKGVKDNKLERGKEGWWMEE